MDELDSDDERIIEKDDLLLPIDLCWLEDDELFNVDAISCAIQRPRDSSITR